MELKELKTVPNLISFFSHQTSDFVPRFLLPYRENFVTLKGYKISLLVRDAKLRCFGWVTKF